MLKGLGRRGVYARHVRRHLAVARQAEEREPDVARRDTCLRADSRHCLIEHLADEFDAS